MSTTQDDPGRRAERLLRWYPRAWRERYGAEFAELLAADITERPHHLPRTLDLIGSGLVARLADAGLAGFPVRGPAGERQQAASLASLGACIAVFAIIGAALWSQLTIGWQWQAPAGTATTAGMVIMSAAMLALTAIAATAVLPVAAVVAARILRGHRRARLAIPALVFAASVAILVIGGRHFGNGWPGTGGHPWAKGELTLAGHQLIGRGLVPGGLAAFSWAVTLAVSTYWLHPAALAAFPAGELAWMAASPLALAAAIWAAATLVRRAPLPVRLLRFEARLAVAACAAMLAFFAGCGCWVASGGQGPFHAGTIDAAGTAILAAALAVAGQAARRARLRSAGSLCLTSLPVASSSPPPRPAWPLPPRAAPRSSLCPTACSRARPSSTGSMGRARCGEGTLRSGQ